MLLLAVCLLLAVFRAEAQKPTIIFPKIPPLISNYIQFHLYTGPTSNDFATLKYDEGLAIPKNPFFKKNATTVFYYPGWGAKTNDSSVITVANAFLSRNKDNFVVIDYSSVVKNGSVLQYIKSVRNGTEIGRALGQYFDKYIGNEQPSEQVLLVGHGLGCQIISNTAKAYSNKFDSITGLDPAFLVYNLPFVNHLSSKDGKFVQIIHTDSGIIGDIRTLGHVDFFPNGGHRVQPFCNNSKQHGCSHNTAYLYYAESVKTPTAFIAKKCSRTVLCDLSHVFCKCNSTTANMGYGVNNTSRGQFYLRTNNSSPFSLGEAGINFKTPLGII